MRFPKSLRVALIVVLAIVAIELGALIYLAGRERAPVVELHDD